MEKQTIKGTDIYNFPGDLSKMLYWMGDNYIDYMIDILATGFRKQDPLTEIVSIKCEKEPLFETLVSESTHEIHSMKVVFSIQILLKDGSGTHWRLFGENIYTASGLNTEDPEIISDFELEKAVQA